MAKYSLPKRFAGAELPCFVCQVKLTDANYSLEHIIPQWMIRAFHLSESTITLPSGEQLSYLNYVLPCCKLCNTELLGAIESELAPLFKPGFPGTPADAIPEAFAVWACKIFAAAHVYQNAFTPTTSSAELLDEFTLPGMLGTYLKMLHGKTVFRHEMLRFPFSIFVFPTKVPADPEKQFDFQVVADQDAFFLRAKHWSILARCDGGWIALHGSHFFEDFQSRKIAPLQAEELAAHFFTMSARQASSPIYFKRQMSDYTLIEYLPLGHANPFVEVADSEDLQFWLPRLTRLPREKLFSDGGRITFLRDSNGDFLDVDPEL